jgi:aryl-alcohol dehydrogenase-like predicted oxidoreductase
MDGTATKFASDGLPHRWLDGLARDVPALAAGCWPLGGPARNGHVPIGWSGLDDDDAHRTLRQAHSLGVRQFDTADVYGFGLSERRLGRLLASVPRDSVIVGSKVGYLPGPDLHPYDPRQIRRQFETSLRNLGTTHLDIYSFHSGDFGPNDAYLDDAVASVRELKSAGAVVAVGMRAPHRFAVEWVATSGHPDGGKAARFLALVDRIRPDILAVRHNYLTPPPEPGHTSVLSFARQRRIGVLLKQVVGQGLLLRPATRSGPQCYALGDHRRDKPWFSPRAEDVLRVELAPVRDHFGPTPEHLIGVALRYALQTAPASVALLGLHTAAQIRAACRALSLPALTADELTLVTTVGLRVRERLIRAVGPGD